MFFKAAGRLRSQTASTTVVINSTFAAVTRPCAPFPPAEETKETAGSNSASGPGHRKGKHLSTGRKNTGRLPDAPRAIAPQGQAPWPGLYARRAAKNAAPRSSLHPFYIVAMFNSFYFSVGLRARASALRFAPGFRWLRSQPLPPTARRRAEKHGTAPGPLISLVFFRLETTCRKTRHLVL